MPLWRRLGIVGACLLIAAGAVILVVHFVQARQPGQASSGSVTVSQAQLIEQQLQQADTLNQQGSTKAALELYDKVLSEDPSNPPALAYAGFLQWNVGQHRQVASLDPDRARRDRDGHQGLARATARPTSSTGSSSRTRITTTPPPWRSSTTSWTTPPRRRAAPGRSRSSAAPTRRPGFRSPPQFSTGTTTTTTTSAP